LARPPEFLLSQNIVGLSRDGIATSQARDKLDQGTVHDGGMEVMRQSSEAMMSFPEGFVWGAATAAYQIEGAAHQDGRGASVWDMFCRKEGAVFDGHSGDVACDHYHLFRDDVRLRVDMGLRAYRLSISWPRVLPDGVGTVNEKGLAFYDELIDALLEAGITPWVTLFHWDYPDALYCRGGWLNPSSVHWFADYTRVIAQRLGDRVRERYGLPIYITENGFSGLDWVSIDGVVRDPQRIDYMHRYLRELARAIREEVDVRGYFHWSLLDNFEWAGGFRQRFGLVHVDYRTLKRTPKESAQWYAALIAGNGRQITEPGPSVQVQVLTHPHRHHAGIVKPTLG
jgi:beta-glucosidase/6-phospho-beta-glucosidase/beta-galactosidase